MAKSLSQSRIASVGFRVLTAGAPVACGPICLVLCGGGGGGGRHVACRIVPWIYRETYNLSIVDFAVQGWIR